MSGPTLFVLIICIIILLALALETANTVREKLAAAESRMLVVILFVIGVIVGVGATLVFQTVNAKITSNFEITR